MEVSSNAEEAVDDARVHEIDWDVYASQYDLLAANNPSYHENIAILRSLLADFCLPEFPVICDIGAGLVTTSVPC